MSGVPIPLGFSFPQQALPVGHRLPRCPAARAFPRCWTFARHEHVRLLLAPANTRHHEARTGWGSYRRSG